jgi:hypothetical protein
MGDKMALEKEEYVEQTYFFRVLRERISQGLSTQEIMESLDQEILSTTKLPMAIGFLRSELKHSGNLSGGFERLGHYFTAFQAHVMRSAENDRMKFSIHHALLCLEKEALYRSGNPTQSGLFIYQFEVLSRNRLGYEDGLNAISKDNFYWKEWREFIADARNQLAVVDFADLLYLRSDWYVIEQRRKDPAYDPSLAPLFGEKEGKIAGANRNRDPLYLFAALQRLLGYPEVPRHVEKSQEQALLTVLQSKVRDLEGRLRLLEQETKGHVDLAEFAKPQLLREDNED